MIRTTLLNNNLKQKIYSKFSSLPAFKNHHNGGFHSRYNISRGMFYILTSVVTVTIGSSFSIHNNNNKNDNTLLNIDQDDQRHKIHEEENNNNHSSLISFLFKPLFQILQQKRRLLSKNENGQGRNNSIDNFFYIRHILRDMFCYLPSSSTTTTICSSSVQEDTNSSLNFSEEASSNSFDYYYEEMKLNDGESLLTKSHALWGSLMGDGLIEHFRVYRRVNLSSLKDDDKNSNNSNTASSTVHRDKMNKDTNNKIDNNSTTTTNKEEILVARVRVGKNLNGHPNIVHGGIISLLVDDCMGWAYEAMGRSKGKTYGDEDFPIVVTANLNVNFRKALPKDTDIVIRIYHDRTKSIGRKIYMIATMTDLKDENIIYSEATSLFITVKK